MSKIKVEVTQTESEARQRASILRERGWTPAQPRKLEKVLWANLCPGGMVDTAEDEDSEVWLVTAEKP